MALSLILRSASKFQPRSSNAAQILLKQHAPCISLVNLNRFSQLPTQNSRYSVLTLRNNVQNVHITNPYLSPKVSLLNCCRQYSAGVDHAKIWALEKFVSLALIGIVPATFAYPNAVLDNIFALATVTHLHWGIEATVVDYVRPIIFGNFIPKVAIMLVYLLSALTLGGLLHINFNDIGIGETVRRFWRLGSTSGSGGKSGAGGSAGQNCK